jgi:hypothetical protein
VHVLADVLLPQEYDASALQALLDCLVHSNLLLLHTSPRWRGVNSSKEPWYGAQYSSQPLPGAVLEAVGQYVAVDGAWVWCQMQRSKGHCTVCWDMC